MENGTYSEPTASDSATQTTISLSDFIARGQVSDVDNAAAVVLVANPGGSGTFSELALVIQKGGPPSNIGTFLLGDRVRINSVTIEDGLIQVDMYTQGPQDPMCCPNQHVINTYSLNVNELIMIRSQVVATNTSTVPVELNGTVWQWSSLFLTDSEGQTSTQDLQDPSRYTLTLMPDEEYSYQADCVQGSGTYNTEGERISFDLGEQPDPECPGNSHAREFLQYLVSVVAFSMDQNELTLVLDANEGRMTFVPGEAVETAASITISSPPPDSQVDPSQPLFVSGSASGLYEASLTVRVEDASGSPLAEEPVSLQGENVGIGAAGTWSVSISLEDISTPSGTLIVYATGPQDDVTWIVQTRENIQFVNP